MLKNINKQRVTTNKGITLIALVVTIVVLLILAGITINAILSEGGILNTAKRAQSIQEEATVREKVQVMLADAQLENIINDTPLFDYLKGEGYDPVDNTEAGSVTITDSGYTITIDKETYQITGITKTHGSDEETGDNTGSGEAQTPVAVTGVSLNKTNVSMPNGGTVNLIASIEPGTATNKEVTWTSEDNTVATVSTNGEVEALKVGSTKITVTTLDGSFTAECNITVEPTVADLIGKEASSTNTYTQDKYGNKVVIPANFKVVANGEQNVVYDYDKNEEGKSTNVPVVQDGIVIKHATDGNEFVWVPVGEIVNDAVDGTTNKTNIQLGRYDTWTMTSTGDTTPPTPPTPKQVASKTAYDTTTESDLISSQFFENSTGTYNGTQYKATGNFETLGSWIANTIDNKGYYIARYEASYGEGGVALSKPSTGTPLNSTASSSTAKTVGQLYNYVTQPDASDASKLMYQATENLGYYSELVNSYAWDTAIIFIQTYEDVDYASQQSLYKDRDISTYDPANTGERGTDVTIGAETTDKVCNIYDMASNVAEWTTETTNGCYNACPDRGGLFLSINTASNRNLDSADLSNFTVAFRSLLNCNAES